MPERSDNRGQDTLGRNHECFSTRVSTRSTMKTPVPASTPSLLENRTRWIAEVAAHIDAMYGDHPVVAVLPDESRVVAGYRRTELHVYVVPGLQALEQCTADITDFRTSSVADALQFVAEVESLRQNTDFPYLRFSGRQRPEF